MEPHRRPQEVQGALRTPSYGGMRGPPEPHAAAAVPAVAERPGSSTDPQGSSTSRGRQIRQRVMQRPGVGTTGAPLKLVANHYRAYLRDNMEDASQYHVFMKPALQSKTLCRNILKKLYEDNVQTCFSYKSYAYDGEGLLFFAGFPFQNKEFKVQLESERSMNPRRAEEIASSSATGSSETTPFKRRRILRSKEFDVRIEFTTAVRMRTISDFRPGQPVSMAQEAIRVLDTVLREHAARRDYLQIKESFFHPVFGGEKDLGGGVLTWTGFHISFKLIQTGLSLNLDCSSALIIKPLPVLEFLTLNLGKPPISFGPNDWNKVWCTVLRLWEAVLSHV
ncbi:hypothetical protein O6H91_Y580500 [Diphasiastrum complanatum]|nr:hypothetical protein O6H91_Y580500 [Diphasiastrum complanatum]